MRCARLRRARGRDARAPGANLRCARPCRGGLVGKPRRAISRFRHQDAQPSPSPSLGEGGRGDEGAHAHGNARASLPGTLIRGARATRAHPGGTRLSFRRTPPTIRHRRARGRAARTPDPAQTTGARAHAGAGLLASPGVPSPVSGIRTPNLPLLPVWEKGARGDEGQKCGEDSGMLANRSSGYPARSHRRGAPSGDKCLQMPALIV
jgi:hypothetical protein